MEAYNDSLEASQNRVAAAIEKITLDVNGSGVLIEINNLIAKLIDNIGVLTATVLTLGVVFNKKALFDVGTKGLAALGTKIMSVGTMFSNFSNIIDKTKWSEIGETINQTYDAQQAGKYNESLLDYANKHKLESTPIANLTGFQNKMLGEDRNYQNHIGEFLSLGLDSKDTKFSDSFETFKKSMDDTAVELAVDSLKTKELAGVKAEQIVDIKKATINSQELTGVTVEQEAAIKAAVAAEKERVKALIQDTETIVTGNGANVQPIGKNLKNNAERGSGGRQVAVGVASIAGMIGGSAGGSGLGEALGLGETGEMIGSVLGGVAGTYAASSLASAFSAGTASLASVGGPFAIVGMLILGAVIKGWKAHKEKLLKEAQETFQKAAERYTSAFNASADISRYSELVAGVDSLGNNVSLTNDDYQEFLDISNSLADAFPSLITRTDDAGNSFVGIGNKVGDVTDKVNELTKTLQHNADVALLDGDLLKKSLDDASKQYGDANSKYSTYTNEKNRLSNNGKVKTDSEIYSLLKDKGIKFDERQIGEGFGERTVSTSDRKEAAGIVDNFLKDFKQEMNEATQSLSNEAQAKVRETLGDSFYDLDDASIQAIYTATSGIAPNSENWEDNIKDITQGMQKFLSENPEMIEFYYADNSSMSSEEYQKSREEMYNTLKSYFPTMTDDDIIKILYTFQYDGDNDLTNSMQKISSEGLDSKIDLNGKNFNEVFGKDFNVTQMANAYELLSAASDDAKFSVEQFKNAVYNKSYGDMGLTQLATQYKNFKKVFDEGEITDNESKQWDIVKGKLDLYAKELGVASGEYDKIINKIKIIGNLTYGGTSELTPSEAQNKVKDYGDIYDYLKNNYNGVWDEDKATLVSNYSELLPFIGKPEDMKKKLKETLDEASNLYEQTIQGQLIITEDGSQAILDTKADEVEDFAKKYNIDLTNFTTLKEAESFLNALTTATMSGDYATWVATMSEYYADDLTNFSNAAASKMQMNQMILKDMGMTTDEINDLGKSAMKDWEDSGKQGNFTDYFGKVVQGMYTNAQAEEMQARFQEIINSYTSGVKFDSGTGSSKKNGDAAEDIASAYDALIDKEYEAMKAYQKNPNSGDTEYYSKKRASLQNKIESLKIKMSSDEKESERLGHLKDIQDAEKEIRNLNDEELADKESWAETLGNSLDRMKQIYEAQLKAADTYEEVIQAQKKLNDLLNEEYEDRVRIANAVIDTAKRNQSYFLPDTKEYDNYTKIISEQYKQIAKEAKAELQRELDRLIGIRMKEVNSKTGKTYSKAEATEWAKKRPEYLDAETAYYEANQDVVQAALDATEEKISYIQSQIDRLDGEKPQEWSTIEQITSYTSSVIDNLNKQVAQYTETLNSGLELTYEQAKQLVDGINDAQKKILQAQIQQQQDIVDLKDKTYEAFTWQINEYIDKLSEYKEKVNEAYDNEIKKLQDINSTKERTIKLTTLLQNLENANKEGKRVFRAGVGWVYEQDRSGIKKAQQELNSFYKEDRISDLQNTKDSENEILDARIKNWQEYLESIEKAYNSYEDKVKQHLLFEEFGVQTQEELFEKFHQDMLNNNLNLKNNLTEYSGVMSSFIDDYTKQMEKLEELLKRFLKLTDISDIKIKMPTILDPMKYYQDYIDTTLSGTNPNTGESWHEGVNEGVNTSGSDRDMDAVNSDLGFDPNTDYSLAIKNATSESEKKQLGQERQNKIDKVYGGKDPAKKGYSTGIENGAVTYTGLAMLHGTPQSPEWIFNNSQMYNFVRNMSTLRTPAFSRNVGEVQGCSYNFYGDIDLPNVKDPSNFFSELMNATDNRISVTKNKL